ncbi:MAG: PEGA domain-containing protein [Planctomycetota bacterium]|nr:PEGA domain-containing protein [Planctomycetota bacterium]
MRITPFCMILALVVAAGSTGCASMVTISSSPPGASIEIDGIRAGITPKAFPVMSSTFGTYHLILRKKGHKTLVTTLKKRVFWGRLIAEVFIPFAWPLALFNAAGPRAQQHFELTPLKPGETDPGVPPIPGRWSRGHRTSRSTEGAKSDTPRAEGADPPPDER